MLLITVSPRPARWTEEENKGSGRTISSIEPSSLFSPFFPPFLFFFHSSEQKNTDSPLQGFPDQAKNCPRQLGDRQLGLCFIAISTPPLLFSLPPFFFFFEGKGNTHQSKRRRRLRPEASSDPPSRYQGRGLFQQSRKVAFSERRTTERRVRRTEFRAQHGRKDSQKARGPPLARFSVYPPE